MGQNQFAESLVEIMLSWMRWLTSWFWNIVNSEGISGGGFLQWFANNWVSLAVFLILAGAVVDWIIWMIRWRPHWLWLRKRQIIYEEVPVKKHRSEMRHESDRESGHESYPKKKVDLRNAPALHRPARDESVLDTDADDYDDPFASGETGAPLDRGIASTGIVSVEEDHFSDWDSAEDPYASEE